MYNTLSVAAKHAVPSLLKVNSGVIASRIRCLNANASISLHLFFSVFLEDCQYNYFVFTIIKHHGGTKHGGA